MKKNIRATATAALALACLAALAAPAIAQDKPVDAKRLITEIVGDYDFSFQGQSLIVQFTDLEYVRSNSPW